MGKGVLVYPVNAPELDKYEDHRERLVPMRWDDRENNKRRQLFDSRLHVTAVNRTGSLSDVAQAIADFEANISNLAITQRNDDFCDLKLDIEVRDVEHVDRLMSALRGLSVVSTIERVVYE